MLTKSEFIAMISSRLGISQAKAGAMVDAVFNLITDQLISVGECQVAGFGKFSVITTSERQGRNPQTGAALTIPAKRKVRFAPSAALKRKVNGGD